MNLTTAPGSNKFPSRVSSIFSVTPGKVTRSIWLLLRRFQHLQRNEQTMSHAAKTGALPDQSGGCVNFSVNIRESRQICVQFHRFPRPRVRVGYSAFQKPCQLIHCTCCSSWRRATRAVWVKVVSMATGELQKALSLLAVAELLTFRLR